MENLIILHTIRNGICTYCDMKIHSQGICTEAMTDARLIKERGRSNEEWVNGSSELAMSMFEMIKDI